MTFLSVSQTTYQQSYAGNYDQMSEIQPEHPLAISVMLWQDASDVIVRIRLCALVCYAVSTCTVRLTYHCTN